MGQQCSSNKPRLLPLSQPISVSTSSDCDTHISDVKPTEQTQQVDAIEIVTSCVGDVTNKIQICSGTTTAQSSANSIGDSQSSTAVTNKQLSLHSPTASSPSPSKSRSRHCHQGKIPIDQTYQILPQVTGYGSNGQVRKCIHHRTLQEYAVKTIAKSRVRRKSDRINREVALLKQVQHPNIVSLCDVYEDENVVNIVTELCHGGELFDKILEKKALSKVSRRSGRTQRAMPPCFRENDAARIIHSLLSAVSYLHSKDIVHRDIKPENILFAERFNEKSTIKLIDFGLSIRHPRQCEPLTSKVGTLHYMAPEVLKGSYDRSCDLWSIGVVACVMLSGQQPFNGTSKDDISEAIQRGLNTSRIENSSLWKGVSKWAKDFIRCMLVVDPRRRLTADMALEHPWLEMARGVHAETNKKR